MKKFNFIALIGILSLFLVTSCNDGDDTPSKASLKLSINGLEDLGSGYAYEGWIMVNGKPISAGVFTVDASGKLSQSSFQIESAYLNSATAYILTIEPKPDSDPSPSAVHVLAGNFSGKTANITVGHEAALGTDFSASKGKFILATPTDGDAMSNELSGIWWLDPTAGPGPGLALATLPSGWEYEGWVVIGGKPISTGKFTAVTGADSDGMFSGTAGAPPFPGEDFLKNAPSGLTFPTNLSGTTAVISVEPKPDNSPAPFAIKPLVGKIPDGAKDHTPYNMSLNASSNPSGTATR